MDDRIDNSTKDFFDALSEGQKERLERIITNKQQYIKKSYASRKRKKKLVITNKNYRTALRFLNRYKYKYESLIKSITRSKRYYNDIWQDAVVFTVARCLYEWDKEKGELRGFLYCSVRNAIYEWLRSNAEHTLNIDSYIKEYAESATEPEIVETTQQKLKRSLEEFLAKNVSARELAVYQCYFRRRKHYSINRLGIDKDTLIKYLDNIISKIIDNRNRIIEQAGIKLYIDINNIDFDALYALLPNGEAIDDNIDDIDDNGEPMESI